VRNVGTQQHNRRQASPKQIYHNNHDLSEGLVVSLLACYSKGPWFTSISKGTRNNKHISHHWEAEIRVNARYVVLSDILQTIGNLQHNSLRKRTQEGYGGLGMWHDGLDKECIQNSGR